MLLETELVFEVSMHVLSSVLSLIWDYKKRLRVNQASRWIKQKTKNFFLDLNAFIKVATGLLIFHLLVTLMY